MNPRTFLWLFFAVVLWGWLILGWSLPPQTGPWGHVITPEQWKRVG
jgi:hypothetical protein